MKNILLSSAISITITLLIAVMAYYLMPVDPIMVIGDEDMLGATITTINASDRLTDSRSVINTNFTNLNSAKIEVSTTTLPNITTLENLVTVGTLTTGTWNADTLTVAYGGTGSTTLLSNAVLLGNGTSGITSVSGYGTAGQFLTSNGAGSAPTWQSASVDQSQDYVWTGNHHFNTGTTTFNGVVSMTDYTSVTSLQIASSSTNQYPTASTSVASKGYVDAQPHIIFDRQVASSSLMAEAAGWGCVDLSSWVGEKESLVFLRVDNEHNDTFACAVRPCDTTWETYNTTDSGTSYVFLGADGSGGEQGTLITSTDSSGKVGIYCSVANTNSDLYLEAYIN